MKLALRARLGRTHARPEPGPRTDGHRHDPDVTSFGPTAGPAGLMTWAALFDGGADVPTRPGAERHRWRRKA